MSIEAKDLRIGNIFWENYGGYVIVTAIGCNKVGDAPNTVSAKAAINGNLSGSFDCASIEPVPLSPELLLKAGFGKGVFYKEECWSIQYYRPCEDKPNAQFLALVKITSENEYSVIIQNDGNEMRVAITSVHYLHQLQNLYYSLTGQELKIEL